MPGRRRHWYDNASSTGTCRTVPAGKRFRSRPLGGLGPSGDCRRELGINPTFGRSLTGAVSDPILAVRPLNFGKMLMVIHMTDGPQAREVIVLGIGDNIFDETVDRGPSDYWECRRQLLLLERTHIKFEYLFRIGEFVLGVIAFVSGMAELSTEFHDPYGKLNLRSSIFDLMLVVAGIALIAYVRFRKPPHSMFKLVEKHEADPD